jgi:hypothetical protein
MKWASGFSNYNVPFCVSVSLEMTLYVLDTDYTEYALLFSCVDIDEEEKQSKLETHSKYNHRDPLQVIPHPILAVKHARCEIYY